MPPNFGLLPDLPERIRDKRRRYGAYRDRALADLAPFHGPLPPPAVPPSDPAQPPTASAPTAALAVPAGA